MPLLTLLEEFMPRLRWLLSAFAVALTLVFLIAEADARAGRGGSFGSRGSRTFTPPAATQTAPNQARPFERTMTQPAQPGSVAATRPGTQGAATGGLFGRPGFLGGLAAGFLGAGLLGLLLGNGLFGGLGGLASFLGLLVQAGLIALVAVMLWRWWQRRTQPAPAMAGGPSLRDIAPERLNQLGLGGTGSAANAGPAFGGGLAQVEITPTDYDAFERLLGEVQDAYSKEDLAALRARITPEMLSYFSEELADNASRGLVNEVSDVKLLQGDLAEAWREGDTEYATVAMRYSLIDRTIERASGRLAEGSGERQEATEVWTFRRARGGDWLLSGIQQA
jgi:predicted lipid-binding transport protein (Tim44 family)